MVARPKGKISHVHCKKIVGGNKQGKWCDSWSLLVDASQVLISRDSPE